jgi:hypothetical protein
VNAPFSCPNSSLSTSAGEIAPQLILMSGRSRLDERAWMARASSSFPVPVSPRTSTVVSVGATFSALRRTSSKLALRPTISPEPWSCRSSSCRYAFTFESSSPRLSAASIRRVVVMAMAACAAKMLSTRNSSTLHGRLR